MLISFQSKASGDVVMFDHVARRLLEMMDRDVQVPSAMYPEDVPKALSNLRRAIDSLPEEEDGAAPKSDEKDAEASVSIRNRAYPLIDLLEASIREQTHVMWEPV